MAIINSASTTRVPCTIKHSLTSKSNWSELQPELLELILSRLTFLQIIRFKSICSSWNRAAISFVSSSLYSRPPLLMLPSPDDCGKYNSDDWDSREYDSDDNDNDSDDSDNDCESRCFYNLEEKKDYTMKYPSKLFNYNNLCIGSSHGWLIVLDIQECKTFLFNPLSEARVELPSLFSYVVYEEFLKFAGFKKAILLSDPSHNKDYGIVAMLYFLAPQILYCKNGDSCWISLNRHETRHYNDITSCNDHLYALTWHNSIEIWGFHGSLLIKKREIHPSAPRKLMEDRRVFNNSNGYLVDSCGDLLLVLRFVMKFGNKSYATKKFHVYKLDSSEENWVEVESLNNQVLFIGINDSMSVSARDFSGCKRNSIYFTDDYWHLIMYEENYYGSHDFGMFNLEENIVKPLINWNNLKRIIPPPLWVLPNPW